AHRRGSAGAACADHGQAVPGGEGVLRPRRVPRLSGPAAAGPVRNRRSTACASAQARETGRNGAGHALSAAWGQGAASMKLDVVQADITTLAVDAIVN